MDIDFYKFPYTYCLLKYGFENAFDQLDYINPGASDAIVRLDYETDRQIKVSKSEAEEKWEALRRR